MTRSTSPSPLDSWVDLNDALMAVTDEKELTRLLAAEQRGRNRTTFIKRIHSRLNKVRADRERRELL